MPDLSILMPARNEMFLRRTIEDVLANLRGDTEVIAVCDGAWADPPIPDHPRVHLIYRPEAIGQRAATNLAARLSTARYVMKLDAHCSVDEGFDVKLIAADEEVGRADVTQIPQMHNLHAFNRRCKGCGHEMYQGPMHAPCDKCKAAVGFERAMVWKPRRGTKTEFWRFNSELHFQYWNDYKSRPAAQGELVDVMSSVGACFFMRRERFLELGGLDEAHGSWGQFGTEIACKSWLSGGLHLMNRRTWFAHMFRTQGGDFGFPYPMSGRQQDAARAHSRKLWLEGAWPGTTRPLSWLIDKFAPIPGWHVPADDEAKRETAPAKKQQLRAARERTLKSLTTGIPKGSSHGADESPIKSPRGESGGPGSRSEPPIDEGSPDAVRRPPSTPAISAVSSKGLCYYSDCRGNEQVLKAVRRQLARAISACPRGQVDDGGWVSRYKLVSVTLQPINFGRNIVLPLERGHLAMFKQILAGLEALDTDVAFLVEHDVLYHPSHFDFTPPRDDVFYYNQRTWRVDATTGQALFYYCNQVSGLCANRQLLVEHYRKRVAHVEEHGFDRNLGFEPGTNRRSRAIDNHGVETWMSAGANIDIKTEFCLTPGRWSQDQFRNKNSCLGWQMADAVPGWGVTKGRFDAFLSDVMRTL